MAASGNYDATHLVKLARIYGLEAATDGNITTYRLDEADRHIRLVVEARESQTRLVVAALAIPLDTTWQLHQILPAEQPNESVVEHLLPLPPSSVTTGQRHTGNGELRIPCI